MNKIVFKYVKIDESHSCWSTRGIWDKANYLSFLLRYKVPNKLTLEDDKGQIIEFFVFESDRSTYNFFTRYKRKNKWRISWVKEFNRKYRPSILEEQLNTKIRKKYRPSKNSYDEEFTIYKGQHYDYRTSNCLLFVIKTDRSSKSTVAISNNPHIFQIKKLFII